MSPEITHNRQPVRLIEIDGESAGQRIDNFLVTKLKGVPKSRIYRILRRGEVRVNKGRIKPAYRLKNGDVVRIPPLRAADQVAVQNRQFPALARRLDKAILYEDPQLLVIDKPSGMAVHGGSGVSQGVIETLRTARPETRFLELVHRLDRDTSGCLLIAKKRSTLRVLHELLRCGGINKRYLALVKGEWQDGKRRVEAPLYKNRIASGERFVRVDDRGKAAITLFKPICRYPQATLIEAQLITGRTHQIRVHAAHIGHPIAGDRKYGNNDFNKQMRTLGLSRLFLHACSLGFRLTGDTAAVQISAPLQPELQQVLDRLEHQQEPPCNTNC